MKRITFTLLLLSFFLALHAQVSTPSAPRRFRADIDYMIPLRYPSRPVMDFSLEMRGDTVEVHLPYMGEVYAPAFTSDGLNFTEPVKGLKQGQDKKGNHVITFETKHDIVTYTFRLTLLLSRRQKSDGGDIHVSLHPSNAQYCSYSGTWERTEISKASK